jgi:hypothetical protein
MKGKAYGQKPFSQSSVHPEIRGCGGILYCVKRNGYVRRNFAGAGGLAIPPRARVQIQIGGAPDLMRAWGETLWKIALAAISSLYMQMVCFV